MSVPSFLKQKAGIPHKGFSVFCTKCSRELDCFGFPVETSGLSVAHIHDPHKRGRVCSFCEPDALLEKPTPPRP